MKNPIESLALILQKTQSVGIWSPFYDPSLHSNPALKDKFEKKGVELTGGDFTGTCYKQHYNAALAYKGFCGGHEEYSYWIPKEEWIRLFDHFGFQLEILDIAERHPNGPAFTIFASKK